MLICVNSNGSSEKHLSDLKFCYLFCVLFLCLFILFSYPIRLSWVAILWLIATSIIVTWDGIFVLLRPRTMLNGDLFQYFFPYELYVKIDTLYGNMDNAFSKAQSYMNFIEAAANIIGLLWYAVSKSPKSSLLLFSASLATCAKTILYAIHGECELVSTTGHNPWKEFVLLYVLPTR